MIRDLHNEKGLSIKKLNIVIVSVAALLLICLGVIVFGVFKTVSTGTNEQIQLYLLKSIKNLCVLLVFAVFMILSIIFFNKFFLVSPIIKAVDRIRTNKRLEFSATREFNFLIRNYNSVHDENRKLMEVLKQEAINANEKYLKIQEEERKSQVISGLASEYNSVYLVDFEEDTMLPYNLGNKISEKLNTEHMKDDHYTVKMEVFITKFVVPEDKKLMAEQSDRTTIQMRLQESGYYRVNFRRYDTDGKIESIDMCVSKIPNQNDLNRVVMAFKNA